MCKNTSAIKESVRFVPLISAPNFKQLDVGPGRLTPLDSRDGLILLLLSSKEGDQLVVWDPVTGDHRLVPVPPSRYQYFAEAVVPSDHDQLKGQLEVIFVGSDDVDANEDDADANGDHVDWVCIFSSNTSDWGEIICLETPAGVLQPLVDQTPPVVINGAIHFTLQDSQGILTYHRGSSTLSIIDLPNDVQEDNPGIVISSDDTLGYAHMDEGVLYKYSHDNVALGWQLMKTITFPTISLEGLFCSVEGTTTIFAQSSDAVYTINIDTDETKELGKAESVGYIIPYQRYCIPARGSSKVKHGPLVKVSPEDDHFLHISKGAEGETKKDDQVTMILKVDDQKLSTGTLSIDKFPQIQCETDDMDVDSKDESKDEEDKKIVPATKENVHAEANNKKPQVKIGSAAAAKPKADSDEEYSDDSSEGDGSYSGDDDEQDKETPKKPESGKKRAAGSVLKTSSDKKAKFTTPSGQKPDDKKGADHVPDLPKKAGKTPATDEKSPKSGGSITCNFCPKTFNSDDALQAHSNAKHKAAGK